MNIFLKSIQDVIDQLDEFKKITSALFNVYDFFLFLITTKLFQFKKKNI